MRVIPLLLLVVACKKSSDLVPSDRAKDVVIRKVTFNQGVSITMVDEQFGVPPDQHEVIVGREGLVRVHVDVDIELWEPREITAVVTANTQPFFTQYLVTQEIEADSLELDRETTFDIVVGRNAIQPGVDLSVELLETGASSGDNANEGAKFDFEDGPWTMRSTGTLAVRLIPIQYQADGSDRLPDVSAGQLELYQNLLEELYPATDIDLSVGRPVAYSEPVLNNGFGWEELLAEVSRMRAAEPGLPANTYFYGLINAEPSFDDFCGAGCVLGLSNLGETTDVETRASIGIGFPGAVSAETLVHELGHAHGRFHAPCGGAGGPDPDFPSPGGAIGAWGWNINTDTLIAPSEGRDLMGYCSPIWVSGYTWSAFADRIATRRSQDLSRIDSEPTYWQRYIRRIDGSFLAVGKPEPRWREPIGQPARVLVDDEDGLRTEPVRWFPSSHLESGMFLVPEDSVFDAKDILELR